MSEQQPPWDPHGQQDPRQYQAQQYPAPQQPYGYQQPYGQQPRQPSFTPDPQPYGQQHYPPQGPPPPFQGSYPPQPMRAYTFYAQGGGRVIIRDDAIVFSPMVRDFTWKRIRWDRAEVAAVSVQPLPRNRCEVAVTRWDGTMRRYRRVRAAAAEVRSAFAVRGYAQP